MIVFGFLFCEQEVQPDDSDRELLYTAGFLVSCYGLGPPGLEDLGLPLLGRGETHRAHSLNKKYKPGTDTSPNGLFEGWGQGILMVPAARLSAHGLLALCPGVGVGGLTVAYHKL